jgi:N-acetylmuramoyl-L-alanine amidase
MGQVDQLRWVRCAVRASRVGACAAGLGCVVAVCCAAAGVRTNTRPTAKSKAAKRIVALSPWEQAEQGRDALEATANETRTRAEYARVMDAYRTIYHANPADAHAPAAVNAVAELLAEQGRDTHDTKSLQAAVGQYEFLQKQYPASSLGVQALLAEGQIEQDDLNDAAAAKEKYKLLLKQHPKSEQAEEAKAGIASLTQGTASRDQKSGRQLSAAGSQLSGKTTISAAAQPTHRDAAAMNGVGSSLPAMAQTSGSVVAAHRDNAAINGTPVVAESEKPVDLALVDAETRPARADNTASAKRSGKLAGVTGIRHWSTATYTRVAIDLGDSVTYEAARVPNPDRIYFDLHGTKLAPELIGKSFAVTDDGFLKKIRAAQYSDDVTRVVLDVNDVTEYSAFLLPNPYRLIIDIHGSKAGSRDLGTSNRIAAVDLSAPQTAAVVRDSPGRPVPNTVATKSASNTTEVAGLSDLPGKVEATRKPTSKPISAVVDTGNREASAVAAQPTHRDSAAMNGAQLAGMNPTHDDEAAMNEAPSSVAFPKTRKGKKAADAALAAATPARAAVPTADGETSLVRALGLKIGRIVIDAGHGGHDSGTLGVGGIQEKDVVLDVALRLGKLLHDRLGAEIIYTRSDDTFIPLETRTAIANKAQADLFLSIHANSSSDASARGVETYYLNFTSDSTALDVAARENAVSDQSIHQLSDLVKKIALKDKIAESREFAADVEGSLYAGLEKGNAGLKDRGVKKAPFVVLIGANMPSILAEISFVTNPRDAEQLEQPDYRERVAESIYKGVARYEGGLSGTRVPTERAAVGQ